MPPAPRRQVGQPVGGHPYPHIRRNILNPIDSPALQRAGDCIPDGLHIRSGLRSRHDPAIAANQKFRKVPFDISAEFHRLSGP